MEVSFQCAIDNPGLAVGLRVVCGTHGEICALQFHELLPFSARKDHIMIRDDPLQDTIQFADVSENLNDLHYCVRMIQSEEMSIFGKVIDHDEDN